MPAFAIVSGNAAGAFAIDPATGVITVADHGLLDFETLSPRWEVPARFELFVEITDSLATTTETLRTAITVTGRSAAGSHLIGSGRAWIGRAGESIIVGRGAGFLLPRA